LSQRWHPEANSPIGSVVETEVPLKKKVRTGKTTRVRQESKGRGKVHLGNPNHICQRCQTVRRRKGPGSGEGEYRTWATGHSKKNEGLKQYNIKTGGSSHGGLEDKQTTGQKGRRSRHRPLGAEDGQKRHIRNPRPRRLLGNPKNKGGEHCSVKIESETNETVEGGDKCQNGGRPLDDWKRQTSKRIKKKRYDTTPQRGRGKGRREIFSGTHDLLSVRGDIDKPINPPQRRGQSGKGTRTV